jgi:parvulin-like peptidyl-prolyl isomerase
LAIVAALPAFGCAKQPPVAEGVIAPPGADRDAKQIIVATVNGIAISGDALDETRERMKASRHSAPASSPGEASRRALDQLIIQELVIQDAARQGVHVGEKDLAEAMRAFIARLGHEEGYEAYLKSRNLSDHEVRAQVERGLLLQLMYGREVKSKVAVTRDDIRKEYDLNAGKYLVPEKISVLDIVISQKQGALAMLNKATEILAALNADQDKDPLKLAPDDAVTVIARDIESGKEPILFDAAGSLREGELSALLETPEGAHIIKVIRRTPRRPMTFEEAEGLIEGKLKGAAEISRFLAWQESLKKDATIEILSEP